jgi:cell division protein ZapB
LQGRFIVADQFTEILFKTMTDTSFKTLDEKVDALIQLCSDMKKENQMLRDSEHNWEGERKALHDKNQLARTRLEKVLQRLKSLEKASS